jgi:dTDP-4-amino-4,6-dideoxygalactose transaminase
LFFDSGRAALYSLGTALRLGNESSVLIPDYVPEGIYAPFRSQGVRIEQYSLDLNLDPVWSELEALLSRSKPSLVVMIHYFGLRKPIERLSLLCHEYDALVLEDLAHVMPAPGHSDFGAHGDFVLYSLPKVIGVPDGAVFESLTARVPISRLRQGTDWRHSLYVAMQLGRLIVSTVSKWARFPRAWWLVEGAMYRCLPSYGLLMRYFESCCRMSAISRLLLRSMSWEDILCRRRRLEAIYEEYLDKDVFRRFVNAESTLSCGMGFPVLVDGERRGLIEWLRRRGIRGIFFGGGWGYIPEGQEHEASRTVLKRHFLFPTSPRMTVEEARYVARVANEWADDIASTAV